MICSDWGGKLKTQEKNENNNIDGQHIGGPFTVYKMRKWFLKAAVT